MDTENLFGHYLGLQAPSLRSLPVSNGSASDTGSVGSRESGKGNKGGKEEDGITDKKLRRRLQNRRAAKVSRARKKAYIELLEGKTKDLQDQIKKLQERNQALEARVTELEKNSGPRRPQREKKATRRFCPYKSSADTAVPEAKAPEKEAKTEEVKLINKESSMETEVGSLFASGAGLSAHDEEIVVPGSPDLSWVNNLEASGLDLPPYDPFSPATGGLWGDPFVQPNQHSAQPRQQKIQQRVSGEQDQSNPGRGPFFRAQAAPQEGGRGSGDIASSAARNNPSQQQQVSLASRPVSQASLRQQEQQALAGLFLLAAVSFLSRAFGSNCRSVRTTAATRFCSVQTSSCQSCLPKLSSSRSKMEIMDSGSWMIPDGIRCGCSASSGSPVVAAPVPFHACRPITVK
uniref:X-box-binding protein 1 n=1 Tax=Lotharella oceanica TaxID=641309 RepID=A0A7S2U210_9EUKA|mmetsp:Transcript_6414/g.12760  ORF Transcript_6414/g.12760 Transcript_6414/m.12760 type:complete len:404 (+) Transcript_6414:95-1306(+)